MKIEIAGVVHIPDNSQQRAITNHHLSIKVQLGMTARTRRCRNTTGGTTNVIRTVG